jgi:hypothetical protein
MKPFVISSAAHQAFTASVDSLPFPKLLATTDFSITALKQNLDKLVTQQQEHLRQTLEEEMETLKVEQIQPQEQQRQYTTTVLGGKVGREMQEQRKTLIEQRETIGQQVGNESMPRYEQQQQGELVGQSASPSRVSEKGSGFQYFFPIVGFPSEQLKPQRQQQPERMEESWPITQEQQGQVEAAPHFTMEGGKSSIPTVSSIVGQQFQPQTQSRSTHTHQPAKKIDKLYFIIQADNPWQDVQWACEWLCANFLCASSDGTMNKTVAPDAPHLYLVAEKDSPAEQHISALLNNCKEKDVRDILTYRAPIDKNALKDVLNANDTLIVMVEQGKRDGAKAVLKDASSPVMCI